MDRQLQEQIKDMSKTIFWKRRTKNLSKSFIKSVTTTGGEEQNLETEYLTLPRILEAKRIRKASDTIKRHLTRKSSEFHVKNNIGQGIHVTPIYYQLSIYRWL